MRLSDYHMDIILLLIIMTFQKDIKDDCPSFGKWEFSSKDLLEDYFLHLVHRCADEKDNCLKKLETEGDMWFMCNSGLFQHGKAAGKNLFEISHSDI